MEPELGRFGRSFTENDVIGRGKSPIYPFGRSASHPVNADGAGSLPEAQPAPHVIRLAILQNEGVKRPGLAGGADRPDDSRTGLVATSLSASELAGVELGTTPNAP